MKSSIFILLLLFKTSVFACCQCAIVSGAMSAVEATAEASLQAYDSAVSTNYEQQIFKKISESLDLIKNRFSELNNAINIEKLNIKCVDEELEQISKIKELQDIDKTVEIIDEFNKD